MDTLRIISIHQQCGGPQRRDDGGKRDHKLNEIQEKFLHETEKLWNTQYDGEHRMDELFVIIFDQRSRQSDWTVNRGVQGEYEEEGGHTRYHTRSGGVPRNHVRLEKRTGGVESCL